MILVKFICMLRLVKLLKLFPVFFLINAADKVARGLASYNLEKGYNNNINSKT